MTTPTVTPIKIATTAARPTMTQVLFFAIHDLLGSTYTWVALLGSPKSGCTGGCMTGRVEDASSWTSMLSWFRFSTGSGVEGRLPPPTTTSGSGQCWFSTKWCGDLDCGKFSGWKSGALDALNNRDGVGEVGEVGETRGAGEVGDNGDSGEIGAVEALRWSSCPWSAPCFSMLAPRC